MKILFNSDTDRRDYYHYKQVRGEGLYFMVYNVLSIILDTNEISSKDFLGLIRYDKRLRDQIYIYLSTLEEFLKEQCCKQLEYSGNKLIRKLDNNVLKNIKTNESYGYNLFKYMALDFNSIIKLIVHFDIDINVNKKTREKKLKLVKELRNKVMHHRFLLIDTLSCESGVQINNHIKEVQGLVNELRDLLPFGWGTGLTNAISRCNKVSNSNELLSNYLVVR